MDHIIVNFQPFTAKQDVMVYVNGVCVQHSKIEIDRIVNVVNGLSKQYKINQIDLYGSEDYLSHFKAEMNTEFADNSGCNIDIIRR